MASTMSFPLIARTEVQGLIGDEGCQVFKYVDGRHTDNQRRDVLGRSSALPPQGAHPVHGGGSRRWDAGDRQRWTAGVLKPMKIDPATLTVRSEDAYNLALTATGSLLLGNKGSA